MTASSRVARIRWRCRRGTRELDILLARLLARGIEQLDAQRLDALERLLECQDPALYAWLTGESLPGDPSLDALVLEIRRIVRGDDA
jgi:antitoxin CptB